MAGSKTIYVCSNCGARFGTWSGRCRNCNEWNTLAETADETVSPRRISASSHHPQPIAEISAGAEVRTPSGIDEFDRILGGGIVAGSSVLIGGDPGIGKSTLLLQVAGALARNGCSALYVTAEESPVQIKLRAERLGVSSSELLVLAETDLKAIIAQVRKCKSRFVVLDSIQMVYKEDVPSAPGSVAQVRECATDLVYLAKRTGATIVLIGHVTKEGGLAGPRLLEHIVDTVLYFEGDRYQLFRILRAFKNRFGATDEIGIFQMRSDGLQPVTNPSAFFLGETGAGKPGCVVTAASEGSRNILVEIQSLVVPCAFGTPRRRVTGVELNRTSMILAVLEKHAHLQLASHDVFVNVAGGVRVSEPAADLAVALAVSGSLLGSSLGGRTIAIGELGLDGEIRGVSGPERRLAEAERLGFTRAVVPKRSRLRYDGAVEQLRIEKIHEALGLLERTTP